MQPRVVPCVTKHERETSEREGEAPSCPIGGMPPNEQQHPLHSQWICTMFLGSPSQLRAEGHTWPAHLCSDAQGLGELQGLSEQQDPGPVSGGTGERSLGEMTG